MTAAAKLLNDLCVVARKDSRKAIQATTPIYIYIYGSNKVNSLTSTVSDRVPLQYQAVNTPPVTVKTGCGRKHGHRLGYRGSRMDGIASEEAVKRTAPVEPRKWDVIRAT